MVDVVNNGSMQKSKFVLRFSLNVTYVSTGSLHYTARLSIMAKSFKNAFLHEQINVVLS